MSKRLFQILDEMNQYDTNNKTRLVEVGYHFLSGQTTKQGAKIEMGMPANAISSIMQNYKIPMLLLVDREEYFKREKVPVKKEIVIHKKVISDSCTMYYFTKSKDHCLCVEHSKSCDFGKTESGCDLKITIHYYNSWDKKELEKITLADVPEVVKDVLNYIG